MTYRSVPAAVAVAAVLLAGCGDHHADSRTTPATPPAPGPIIGTTTQPPRDPLSTGERREATAAVRRFLSGYLPYLYGRGLPGRVAPVTPSVARTLRSGSARVTPAQRHRHPRVAALRVIGQTARSALAAVRIGDGGPAPYQLTLTVELRGGRWVVSDLGDDG
ncbi:MAG: hypothetical protein AB7V58_10195 [Solirubrobacterales bacterium]